MYRNYLKRIIDFVLAMTALIILSPLFIIVALLVRLKLGSPVIFKQKRPGRDEMIFTIYKFRTMTDERDHNGELLPDCDRLTNFGKLLRSTSLDELPELINIVKGEMSIVGPRPLYVRYLPYYSEQQKIRHTVLPGLTGLAQINGRNNTTWEERFAYDQDYVKNLSFGNDLRIILATVKKVLAREDIGERKEKDMETGLEDFDSYCRRRQAEAGL